MIWVVATRNQGKTSEIRSLLNNFPIEIKNLNDFGKIPEVEETGNTFEENAYLKASFTSRILGIPALADDSGLVVDVLNGAPGIHSARYGGPDTTDMQNYMKLLEAMKDQPNRHARFECVISIAIPQGQALTYEGRCEGIISEKPMGIHGFGYDPVFFYPPLNKTFAELTLEEKNQVSHRALALKQIQQECDKILI